ATLPWSVDECKPRAQRACLATFTDSPIDAKSYKTCLDGRAALGPQCLYSDGTTNCLYLAQGTLPVGAPCVTTVYVHPDIGVGPPPAEQLVPRCAHGWCGANGQAHCGTCSAAYPPGHSCQYDEQCDPGTGNYCDVNGVCVPFAKEGESCLAPNRKC